ncbi:MAG: CopD family protein [Pseudomonadota bacterium]|nr:CopD family protein [Pseudomonadota bacterium]
MELGGWDAAAVCAKAITYAATLGAAGAIFFLAYCGSLLQEPQRSRIRRLIGILLIVSAVVSCAKILLIAATMSGDLAGMFDQDFARMILGAGEGLATGMRMAGLALAAFAVASSPRFRALALVGAAAASMSFAGVGHVRGLTNIAPSLLLWLHLLCAAFWLGALAPLLITARSRNDSQIAAVASRFGQLALGVVVLLLSAGLSLLWILIRDAAQFWSSDYGRMMAIKLLTVAALLGIAAVNKLYLTPRLLRGDPRAFTQFRRTVQTEMVVGALILLITATLTTVTGPPR